jgi:hypothetical protein
MTSDDDKRALDRFVAGLDVGEDALASAVTARAVDRTIVIEALLKALASPQADIRRRAAQRVARMADVAPRVQAELTLIAATDPDERVSEACAAALRAHVLLEQDAASAAPRSDHEPASPPLVERFLASLMLRPMIMRSARQPLVLLLPRNRAELPEMRGTLMDADDGAVLVVLSALPPQFAATHPTLRVRRDADSDAFTAIATATEPVSADGAATIRIGPEVGPADEVRRWFGREIELVVTDR